MKEAAGEANLTVVTIILIAAIVAIVTPIVTSMMGNVGKQSCCQNAGGYWQGGKCKNADGTDFTGTYWDETNKKCA